MIASKEDARRILSHHLTTGEPLNADQVTDIVVNELAKASDFDDVGGGLYRHTDLPEIDTRAADCDLCSPRTVVDCPAGACPTCDHHKLPTTNDRGDA